MGNVQQQWDKFELMLDSHQLMIKEQVEMTSNLKPFGVSESELGYQSQLESQFGLHYNQPFRSLALTAENRILVFLTASNEIRFKSV